ncbi:YhcN/YlaJ family sporulation lipoprotein [Alkalihalobacillus sp. AL-G]|uniref:YhcN/YlaJ family sporulation lipoprotein n=1 Tax=Alkalihalobacillus sp. AL-G TaxID=2926399 RepID=UPI00272B0249|nr:YhcN/YlaJ family sporulation lipoprotein [Alkalihalobacillus sp. AL-G]WLD91559.1 YhcN/YlaJ family sporulation lipoprotein [Alkalihalobacillus sp. AL-G]
MQISQRKYLIIITLFTMIFMSACNNNDDQAQEGAETKEITYTKEPYIIKSGEKVKGVEDLRMVQAKDKLLVAIKVTNFDRFQLQEINKKVKKKLKKQHPNKKVTVTPDKKIYMEIEKLEKEIKTEHLDEEAVHKKVKKLIKLSKEKG